MEFTLCSVALLGLCYIVIVASSDLSLELCLRRMFNWCCILELVGCNGGFLILWVCTLNERSCGCRLLTRFSLVVLDCSLFWALYCCFVTMV